MSKLIIPKNLNEWFGTLCKSDKEDIYKYWLRKDHFIYVEPPEPTKPIDYFEHSGNATYSGR